MNSKPQISKEIFWVALGGMAGALLRDGTNQLLPHAADGTVLLTATFIENIIGSFLIGLIFFLLKGRVVKNRFLSLFLLTGLIGSYTTYSGFMVEAFFYSKESVTMMLLYLFSQIFTGVLAVFAGGYVAKSFTSKK